MRVVAGSARGRRLRAPVGRSTRPTSDRVREAVFNMLASRDAVDGATVLDLFAGTGAMGIEALSRGASAATFVESDGAAVEAIRANLALTGLGGGARVVRADALLWLEGGGAFDLAFVDPPYGFDGWDRLLRHLDAGRAVLESDRPVHVADPWEAVQDRRYGGTVVTLVHRKKGLV
ncbi:MAG TPA: 16S rRNA (guanine(966)-N(2))-methyltransferase RsmD [Acidimicrobiales bacterium]|nr:16S rRNA (guanine(966)-N(2))-methyltransferase RsmD [Acidimicrobiales bacterium]